MAIELQTAIPDTGWVNLPLGVEATGEAAYRKVGDMVTFRFDGTVGVGGSPLAANLPREVRPTVQVSRAIYRSSTSARFSVNTNGALQVLPVDTTVRTTIEESWLTT